MRALVRYSIHCLPFIPLLVCATIAKSEIAVTDCLEANPHIGIAAGANAQEAQQKSVAACVSQGGQAACCNVYAVIARGSSSKDTVCVAGAQGASGDFGWGVGSTKAKATAAALVSCKDSGFPGKYCRQHGAVVCQPSPQP